MKKIILIAALSLSFSQSLFAQTTIHIGSKTFTESYILAEILSQIIESHPDYRVNRRFGLGSTGIVHAAIKKNEIQLYPEYTGTISQAILKSKTPLSRDEINQRLKTEGLTISQPLGFNNTYALAVKQALSDQLKLTKISQLKNHPQLRVATSHEFYERKDGFLELSKHYQFQLKNLSLMEHSLSYQAIENGNADLIDVYSTDAKIKTLELFSLEDDKAFFPRYDALIVAHQDFVKNHSKLWKALRSAIEGKISESQMIQLNSLVDFDKKSFRFAAQSFLSDKPVAQQGGMSLNWERLARLTREHSLLVFLSLLGATLIGLPLGVLASRNPWLGQGILAVSGLLQTIPSIALLCFLIPLFGIGLVPSLVALFLYSLLPIISSTYTGLISIPKSITEPARALGLTPAQSLLKIEVPIASIHILNGMKTSAIIGIGTATLAAFIGAGGYGSLIVTGLALNDNSIVLQGAVPATLMALLMHVGFYFLEKFLIPKGLQKTA